MLEGKNVLVTGGTGSLGHALVRRLLTGEMGMPARITVFSRDEAKQHYMRLAHLQRAAATDEVIYDNARDILKFHIGDVRDYASLANAVRDHHVVFNAAALKQVPSCEYFPAEAVATNVQGPLNLVRAVLETRNNVENVVGISTDKACKPVNVMGMTKALQERILIEANVRSRHIRWNGVRYGNVIASRGSVVPLFLDQIAKGGPVTITLKEMTRFLLSLDRAVDTVFATLRHGKAGELFVPRVPSARVVDVARSLMAGHDIPIKFTGIRPGEKIHEIMVSEEECHRTVERAGHYVIRPSLPELAGDVTKPALASEYSSAVVTLDDVGLKSLLAPYLSGKATFLE